MFDDLLDIIFLEDFLAPLAATVKDWTQGPGCYFGVPILGGHSKREIRRILDRQGVQPWGVIYSDEEIIFTVREDQKREAHDALTRAGVHVLYPKIEG